MARVHHPYVFAVYAHVDDLINGIRSLKNADQKLIQVFSPVPYHEIEHELDRKPSPVRVFTLIGGLAGLAIGWGITIGPISNYNLHVGGKPLLSLPPFGVVAYICTILFGAVATVIGMIVNARLPQVRLVVGYDERISSDHFGIQVYCTDKAADKVMNLCRQSGAVNVKHVGVE